MQLPDVYFAFQWRRGERLFLFHREPSGRIRVVRAVEAEPPEGSLLVHGPGTPIWDADFLGLLTRVRDRGGAVLALGAVLERCGFPSRMRREELLERLGAARIDIEDPERAGREILERLAEILEGVEDPQPSRAEHQRSPSPLLVSDVMRAPDAPGVYAFLSSDGGTVYVGKARSLRRRLASHLRARAGEPAKRAALIAGATEVRWEETGSELEALLREHLAIRRERPAINVQRSAHSRPRGAWRERAAAVLLPSAEAGRQVIVLVAGDGRFHMERVEREAKVPRRLWKHVGDFLSKRGHGRGPGGETLTSEEAAELAEITLSWLVLHDSGVHQIDMTHETATPELRLRLAGLLALDAQMDRVHVR